MVVVMVVVAASFGSGRSETSRSGEVEGVMMSALRGQMAVGPAVFHDGTGGVAVAPVGGVSSLLLLLLSMPFTRFLDSDTTFLENKAQ